MNRILWLLIFLLIQYIPSAQINWFNPQKNSKDIFVYKISAITAENYIKQDSIPINNFINITPFAILQNTSLIDSLPVGHYVFVSIINNSINAEIKVNTTLVIYPLINRQLHLFEVRNKFGNFIDANVFVNDKPIIAVAKGLYKLNKNRLTEKPFIKICSLGDTAFVSYEKQDYNITLTKQRWYNFKNTNLGQVLFWLPNQIIALFKKQKKNKHQLSPLHKGYIVFNQPKYKLTDTVKFKAYILDTKEKPLTKPLQVYLNYYHKNKYFKQLLKTLKPVSSGAYVYEFALNDTLYNDVNYTISFAYLNKENEIFKGSFKTEDYVLDEVATYNLTSNKSIYYSEDSIEFTALAKDANDLPLLDGKVRLILTINTLYNYNSDSLYINDTLYNNLKALETKGDTKFILKNNQLPKASYTLKATAIFSNSNNEIQERTVYIEIKESHKEIRTSIHQDSVYANFYINGVLQNAIGRLNIDGENNVEQTINITYPFKAKIDPLATDYDFEVFDNDITSARKHMRVNNYTVTFSRKNNVDTIGFALHNPNKIKVNYFILDGTKVIAILSSHEPTIIWQKQVHNKRKLYTLKYNYVWAGKQQEFTEKIGLLYNIVNIDIKNKQEVYPGEKDTIEVTVKDYKGNALPNFNLTAASYNSQFKNDISIKEPPYLARYNQKGLLNKDAYSPTATEQIYISKNYPLYANKAWIKKFGVDSLWYYQMLYPANKVQIFSTQISSFYPQLAVYVVDDGKPIPVYILYVDRKPVFYNLTNVQQPYSFFTFSRYTQIGLRLFDKYIEIDGVYLQPYYKHNIVIDVANLPAKCKVNAVKEYYDSREVNMIESSVLQLQKNYSNFYIWQNNIVATDNKSINKEAHLIGPFNAWDSVHFFQPANMDIHFKFEPGYEYSFSKNILRLEKKAVLQSSINLKKSDKPQYYLQSISNYNWPNNFGDTITDPPIITYPAAPSYTNMHITRGKKKYEFFQNKKLAKLLIQYPKDTIISYVALYRLKDSQTIVLETESLYELPEGFYTMHLITNKFNVAKTNIEIKPNSTLYFKTTKLVFKENKKLIDSLNGLIIGEPDEQINTQYDTIKVKEDTTVYKPIYNGIHFLAGKIIDAQGNMPVPYASVIIKGTKKGVTTNTKGEFVLQNMTEGVYTLLISSVGYETKEITISTSDDITNEPTLINIEPSYNFLDDVVVVGYATMRKSSSTGAVAKISANEFNESNTLQGRIAGLQVQQNLVLPGADAKALIRGTSSINNNSKPLYVINGILYNAMPTDIRFEEIENIEVLTDAQATALYGTRGAGGVIILNTKKGSVIRTQFRDYAFWKPNFFTNSNGKATIEVIYPDNITSWETYILGMDKKKRMGKAITYTKAFKPIMAQLSLPQFLIEEDEVDVIAKTVNYTKNQYNYHANFTVSNLIDKTINTAVQSSASNIEKIKVIAPFTDTLKTKFTLQTSTGFKDGEERKIPIFKKGINETIGTFWFLYNDSVVAYNKQDDAGYIEISAVSNTIDLLLNEVEHLKKYPFYCMEQTASKLKGLLFSKQIKEHLDLPFKEAKEIEHLKTKLQKAQNFDGSWSWWEGGKGNIYITNYIINTLLLIQQDELVKMNIRNGLLYLQNILPYLNKDELLLTLYTMNLANHAFDYSPYFNKLSFDSLTLHQKWQYVKIKQQQNANYAKEIDTLIKMANIGLLGSMSWGVENYRWYNNQKATTLIAFDVCKNDDSYKHYIPAITQYFLQERKNGYWTNTVESANILAALLPTALAEEKNFTKKPSLQILGDTTATILKFPFNKVMSTNIRQLQFSKIGGGFMFVTAFQHKWNASPNVVDDKFVIKTHFAKNGDKQTFLLAGERVKMMVNIEVLKDAEYVMIDVPIPAGCIVASKSKTNNMHREYFKNKVLMFAEFLAKGNYTYEIELEPRYTGKFTINAAKAELMYFPTFYGRNENKWIEIKD